MMVDFNFGTIAVFFVLNLSYYRMYLQLPKQTDYEMCLNQLSIQ